jgi:hypothetical protein
MHYDLFDIFKCYGNVSASKAAHSTERGALPTVDINSHFILLFRYYYMCQITYNVRDIVIRRCNIEIVSLFYANFYHITSNFPACIEI